MDVSQMVSEMGVLRCRCYVRDSLVGLAGQGSGETRQGCNSRQSPVKVASLGSCGEHWTVRYSSELSRPEAVQTSWAFILH